MLAWNGSCFYKVCKTHMSSVNVLQNKDKQENVLVNLPAAVPGWAQLPVQPLPIAAAGVGQEQLWSFPFPAPGQNSMWGSGDRRGVGRTNEHWGKRRGYQEWGIFTWFGDLKKVSNCCSHHVVCPSHWNQEKLGGRMQPPLQHQVTAPSLLFTKSWILLDPMRYGQILMVLLIIVLSLIWNLDPYRIGISLEEGMRWSTEDIGCP